MNNLKFLFLALVSLLLALSCKCNKHSINESCEKLLIAEIKKVWSADSINIEYQDIKEELYFPTLKCLRVEIYNAKTKVLNFKTLDMDAYSGIDSFELTENQLEEEGLFIKNLIDENCSIQDRDFVCVTFFWLDESQSSFRFDFNYSLGSNIATETVVN